MLLLGNPFITSKQSPFSIVAVIIPTEYIKICVHTSKKVVSTSNNMTQAADIAFGTQHEIDVLPRINTLLGTDLVRNPNKYATFDYINGNGNVFVELKSRRINHNQYPTALIGLNKVRLCQSLFDTTFYFFYKYNDGLFYIKYDRDQFSKFNTIVGYKRSCRSDCYNRPDDVVEIPYTALTRVTLEPEWQ